MRCSLRETLLEEKILRIGGGRRKRDAEFLDCEVDGRKEVAPRPFYHPKGIRTVCKVVSDTKEA